MQKFGIVCLLSFVPVAAMAAPPAVVAHVQMAGDANKTHAPAVDTQFRTVLWLTSVEKEAAQSQMQAARSFTMVQQGKMFSPHMLVVPVGSTVSFPNKDPFFHNVFSLFNGKRFDLGLYQSGQSRNVLFNRVGVSYIFCNIHPEMSAVILALDTPYFGYPDADGNIRLQDVPQGTYTLQVWSEATSPAALHALTRRVTIGNSGTDLGVISIQEAPGMLASHANKFGEPYDTHTSPAY